MIDVALLQQLADDPQWVGAKLGILAVLHTWSRDLSYHPHVHLLATAGGDKLVKIWDLASGVEIQSLKGHTDAVESVAFSSDGKHVAFITQGVVKTVTITGTDVTQVMPLPRSGNESGGEGSSPEMEGQPYLSAAFAAENPALRWLLKSFSRTANSASSPWLDRKG